MNSYCFDDILIDPCVSDIDSRKTINLSVDIARYPRSLILRTPLISSCMSTVTESKMAIDMALQGGLGIIHRYMPIEKQIKEVERVKRHLQYIIEEPYCISTHKADEKTPGIMQTSIGLAGPTGLTTMNDYEENEKKYNIGSFLVTHYMTGQIVGIITKKDYELWKSVSLIRKCPNTILDNMSEITTAYMNYEHECSGKSMDDILKLAMELIVYHKVEKIPIIDDTCMIRGLITHKNIKHYLANRMTASLDGQGRLLVGAAIGIKHKDELDKLKQLVDCGIDLVCVDVANGFNTHVRDFIIQIRSLYPQLIIMAGNICSADGFKFLDDIDVDCIRVGIGSGSICTTRAETGVGKLQWSAVNECFQYLKQLDFSHHAKIISDGGSLGKTGNKAKALVTGSSAVMLGHTLAGTNSSPGSIIIRNGKKCKYFRGMASTMAYLENQEAKGSTDIDTKFNPEGVDGFVEIKGNVSDIIEQINGGIRSCLSYVGCHSIDDLHDKRKVDGIKFTLVTSIGMAETNTRISKF